MAWAAPRAPSGAAPSGPSAKQTRRREINLNLKWQDFVQSGEQLGLNHEVTELKGKRPEEQGGPSHYVQTVTSAGGVGSRFAIDKYWRLRIGGSHKAEHLYLKLNRFHCVLLFFLLLASREQLIILPKKMKTAYLVFHLRLLHTKIEMFLQPTLCCTSHVWMGKSWWHHWRPISGPTVCLAPTFWKMVFLARTAGTPLAGYWHVG